MNIWALIYRFACLTLVGLVVVAVLVAFYPKIRQTREMQLQEQRLAEEIEIDKALVQMLKSKSDKIQNDPRYLERVAREDLGLAKPGETVFKFIDESVTNQQARP
jgi:cell division protein FtsB